MFLTLLAPLLLVLVPHQDSAEGLEALAKRLKTERDRAGEAVVQQIGALKTREAMQALIDSYSELQTLYMRREVLRALAGFDGVDGAEQPAVQKIADAATGEVARELREAALDLLAECAHLGKGMLAKIVQSPADDGIRERAMRLFVERATEDDRPFFVSVYKLGIEPQKAVTKLKKGKEPELRVYVLPRLREMALEQIAEKMAVNELVDAATTRSRDGDDIRRDGVRRIALAELDRRKDKRAVDIARKAYADVSEQPENRVLAAGILARADGAKMADDFFEDGLKDWTVTPVELRDVLAELLAQMQDKSVDAKLEKMLGPKSSPDEKRFAVRVLAKKPGEKLVKGIEKLLDDPDPQVQIAAADALVRRGDPAAIAALEKLLASKRPEVKGAGMDALGALQTGEEAWRTRLVADAESADAEVRNSALGQLGRVADNRNTAIFAKAIENPDWSTRLIALNGLRIIGSVDAIDAIIGRFPKEEGRMRREFCDALWRLTGQALPPDPAEWTAWWQKTKSGFKGLGTGDLLRMQKQEDERELRQTAANAFYGVRIVSHRVVFIIDRSGSMNEATRSPYVGRLGEPRMQVAKRELVKCLRDLEPGTLFNIVDFSDGVSRWLEGGIAQSRDKDSAEAIAYVEKLAPNGGTNLFGSLEAAFADPDVDTIYLLSDGEPSVGAVVDQSEIRERVRQWNQNRKVVLHTISIGGKFRVMEWLAEDTGGTHVRYD